MAFIPASQIVRVVVEQLIASQIVANVFHVDANEPVTSAVINLILDEFETWVNDSFSQLQSEDAQSTGVSGRDLTASTGLLVERPFTTPVDGVIASPVLPNNVAVCMTLFTDLSGRSYRGRSYVGGIGESTIVASSLDPSTATFFATMYIDLVDALSLAGYELVVTSFQTANAPRVSAVSTPVTAIGCNTVTDSQRRRLPGRGT